MENENVSNLVQDQSMQGKNTVLVVLWGIVALVYIINLLLASARTGVSPFLGIIFSFAVPAIGMCFLIIRKKTYKSSALLAIVLFIFNGNSAAKILGSGDLNPVAMFITLFILALFLAIFFVSKNLYKKQNPGKNLLSF